MLVVDYRHNAWQNRVARYLVSGVVESLPAAHPNISVNLDNSSTDVSQCCKNVLYSAARMCPSAARTFFTVQPAA